MILLTITEKKLIINSLLSGMEGITNSFRLRLKHYQH